MKLRIVGKILSVLPIAALYMTLAPAAYADGCSNASLAGGWAFTLTGTAFFPSPNGSVPVLVAAVGTFTADGQGNFNGAEARSVGGGYADETVTGNWTVSSNCRGTFSAKIYESGQLVRISLASMVVDDDSKEFRLVQKSLTLPDGTNVPVVITLEARKQHSDQ
jgi:hypothetical protein